MPYVTRRDFVRFFSAIPVLSWFVRAVDGSPVDHALLLGRPIVDHAWFLGNSAESQELKNQTKALGANRVAFEVIGHEHTSVLRLEGTEANLERVREETNRTIMLPALTFSKSSPKRGLPFAFILVSPPRYDGQRGIARWYNSFCLEPGVVTADLFRYHNEWSRIMLEVMADTAEEVLNLLERVLGSEWIQRTETMIVRQAMVA